MEDLFVMPQVSDNEDDICQPEVAVDDVVVLDSCAVVGNDVLKPDATRAACAAAQKAAKKAVEKCKEICRKAFFMEDTKAWHAARENVTLVKYFTSSRNASDGQPLRLVCKSVPLLDDKRSTALASTSSISEMSARNPEDTCRPCHK